MAVVIDNATGLAVDVPNAQELLGAGTHSIPLIDLEGNPVNAPVTEAPNLIQQGFRQPSAPELADMLKYSKFSAPGEQLKAAAEKVASSASLGLSTGLEVMSGVNPEDIRAREEVHASEHPVLVVGEELAGMLAPLGAMGKAGKAVAGMAEAAAARAGAAQAVGRVGGAATRFGIENMVLQSGNEVHKMFAADPEQSAESALADIGLAGVLGAGFGGALKGTSELWNIGPGKKLDALLKSVRDRAGGISDDLAKTAGIDLEPELRAAFGDNQLARETYQILQESNSGAGARMQQLSRDFNKKVQTGIADTLGRTESQIEAVEHMSKAEIGDKLRASLQDELEPRIKLVSEQYKQLERSYKGIELNAEAQANLANRITEAAAEHGWLKLPNSEEAKLVKDLLQALPKQETLNDLRVLSSAIRSEANAKQLWQLQKTVRNIFGDVEDGLVRNALGQSAPEALAAHDAARSAYRANAELIDELNSRLHVGKHSGPESFMAALQDMNPEQIASRLNIANDVNLQQLLAKEFPGLLNTLREYEIDKILSKSLGKADNLLDSKKLFKEIDKLSPEHRAFLFNQTQQDRLGAMKRIVEQVPVRMNPSGTARTIDKLYSEAAPAALATAAMIMDHSGVGAYLIGKALQHVGKEGPDAVRMAWLKYLGSASEVSAEGFKAAAQLAAANIKAESKLNKAVKAIFSGESAVKGVDASERAALDKQVAALSADPSKLLDVNGKLAHYMPEHATAMTAAAARNVTYLTNLRPDVTPATPFEGKKVASNTDKAKYEAALDIAQNPLVVLDYIKRGTLTINDIAHLQAMYPALYQRMQAKIGEHLVNAVADGSAVPYHTRLVLSMFMQSPLDSSLKPENVQSAQATFMFTPQPKHGAPAASKMNNLVKSTSMSATPGQARAMHRLGK